MKYPTNHRELFLMAIDDAVNVLLIKKYDGGDFFMRFECRRLQRWARHYRDQHENELIDLDLPDDLFGIYYDDSDSDSEIEETLDQWELNGCLF